MRATAHEPGQKSIALSMVRRERRQVMLAQHLRELIDRLGVQTWIERLGDPIAEAKAP